MKILLTHSTHIHVPNQLSYSWGTGAVPIKERGCKPKANPSFVSTELRNQV